LPDRNAPEAGRRYLELVREWELRMEATRTAVDSVVRDIAVALQDIVRSQKRTRQSGGSVSLAHLLPRDAVTRYREALRGVAVPKNVRLIVAAPRAPYSFVETHVLAVGHDSGSPNLNA
jgi:gas vesicle protein GvpL/GvpF